MITLHSKTSASRRLRRAIHGAVFGLFMVATLVMWTQQIYAGQLTTRWKLISNGASHTCAVDSSNAIYCWGINNTAQLGNGTIIASYTPVLVDVVGTPLAGKTVTDISAGGSHTCVVASGAAYCWGLNTNGQLGDASMTQRPKPVAVSTTGALAGKTVTDISAGTAHTCAIASGSAVCWGLQTNGRLGNNATIAANISSPTAVSTSTVLNGVALDSITAGDRHSCALDTAGNGAAYCWGLNTNGQLGNGSTTTSGVPVIVTASGVLSGKTITQVAAGSAHTCAVASGAAYCWGLQTSGRLGNGASSAANITTPVAITPGAMSGKTVVEISSSGTYTCAVASGAAYCWGNNAATLVTLGNGTTTIATTPVAVTADAGVLGGKTVVDISASSASTSCALSSEGTLHCWGASAYGERGDNTTTGVLALPLPVTTNGVLSGKTVTMVAAGATHSCAVASGAVYCWGANSNGQLGNASTTASYVPVAVKADGAMVGKAIAQVSVGTSHTCARATTNEVYCWGLQTNGRLANGVATAANITSPVAITMGAMTGKTVADISAGATHTCAIADSAAYCWGQNTNGQVGNTTTTDAASPVAVTATAGLLGGKTVTEISAGTSFSCAVASGAAYCWGLNTSNQLGNGSTTQATAPVAVTAAAGGLAGTTVTDISAGTVHACAVANSAAYCWGSNANGRLGDNSVTNRSTPVAVTTTGVLAGKSVTKISAGGSHTCAIASGSNFCWGLNSSSQVGDGTGTQRAAPVAVIAYQGFTNSSQSAISAGNIHSCAVQAGSLYCWGSNANGQSAPGDYVRVPSTVESSNLDHSADIIANNYRLFVASSEASSSTPLAATNTAGQLGAANQAFRARLTLSPSGAGLGIQPGDNLYVAQVAARVAASCSLQTTGWEAITSSTPIGYASTAGLSHDSPAVASSLDPVTTGAVLQTYRSASGNFTNTNYIGEGQTGIWDLSLSATAAAVPGTSYCLRLAYSDGTPLEQYQQSAEVRTYGQLATSFVDANGASIANPTAALATTNLSVVCQTVTGSLASPTQRLRIANNTSVAGWSVSIAPTAGSSAVWQKSGGGSGYDVNDPGGCADSDSDGMAGQLKVNASTSSIEAQSGCSTTGINKGSDAAFGSLGSDITLLSSSSTTPTNCYWDATNLQVEQKIPAGQSAGNYSVDMTVTVVAQ